MIDFFTKDFRIGDGSVAVVLYSIEKRWIVMFVTNVVLVKILLYLIRSPARDILGGYCSSRRKQSVNVFAYLFSMCYRLSDLPRPKTNVLANRSKTSSSAFIVGSRKLEKRTARNRNETYFICRHYAWVIEVDSRFWNAHPNYYRRLSTLSQDSKVLDAVLSRLDIRILCSCL